jgi:hypothetical protein
MNKTKLGGVVLIAVLASGCASMGVEPWERDILAKDEMQLTTDAVEAQIDDIERRPRIRRRRLRLQLRSAS